MAIHGVDPKCYILALFVRDDKQRFLLGDDPFEFKDKQLHFQPNVVANDVVEVQGNDGVLLAGQVRRAGTQEFDGYVGNGTTSKAEVEVKRREFLQFFRKNHFYKVIYVFPDGSAIQRKQGFLVDDPTVEELYQQYPAYHVALNFQDVNYYTYSEDDEGEEIYSEEAIIKLVGGGATGGLIWDSYGVVWEEPWSDEAEAEGTEIQVNNNNPAKARVDLENVYGDTYQQTYSGKNLYQTIGASSNGVTGTLQSDGTLKITGKATGNSSNFTGHMATNLPAGEYTFSLTKALPFRTLLRGGDGQNHWVIEAGQTSATSTISGTLTEIWVWGYQLVSGTEYNETVGLQLEAGSTATPFEPYVGGTPSPNPDYPQNVQVVTGRQVVTISDGGSQSQEYEVNLGKNLFNTFLFDGAAHTGDTTVSVNTDGSITLSGNTSTSGYCRFNGTLLSSLAPSLKVGKTYYLYVSGGNSDRIYLFGSNTYWNSGSSRTILQSDLESDIIIYGGYGTTSTVYLMITESLDGSYAPYFTPIELCKIGNYQDYIYKSGDDWYLHKATTSFVIDGTKGNYYGTSDWYYVSFSNLGVTNVSGAVPYSSLFKHYAYQTFAGDHTLVGMAQSNSNFVVRNTHYSDAAGYQTWFANSLPKFYYPLATPTDTQITNASLIAQLDALDSSWLFIGQNNILVSASSPNLPAPIKFSYMTKYAPLGAEWEEGGTKGPTIVDVNAIDNTYPVWELTGPSVNPTISVITTNTTLTYVGTITASQKLEIDMLNKMATLNGTSVIGNVSGDWVYMAPGTNRISYTAGNTDAPDSTLYWQEVVG